MDFRRTAQEVCNLVRGVSPWPGAWTEFGGGVLKIWQARVAQGSGLAGEVLPAGTGQGLVVALGDGGVHVAGGAFQHTGIAAQFKLGELGNAVHRVVAQGRGKGLGQGVTGDIVLINGGHGIVEGGLGLAFGVLDVYKSQTPSFQHS